MHKYFILALGLTYTVPLAEPYRLDLSTGQPIADLFPGSLRLLTPFLNITGGFALAFGALFSAWIFMPGSSHCAISPRSSSLSAVCS